jgi:acyl carrier protein
MGQGDALRDRVLRVVREATARGLGRDRLDIGPDDLFYDLGADSLLLATLRRVLERAYSVRIERRELAAASPRLLSALVAARMAPGGGAGDRGSALAGRLRPAGGERVVDVARLSFAQQRLWFLHRLFPDRTWYKEVAVRDAGLGAARPGSRCGAALSGGGVRAGGGSGGRAGAARSRRSASRWRWRGAWPGCASS